MEERNRDQNEAGTGLMNILRRDVLSGTAGVGIGGLLASEGARAERGGHARRKGTPTAKCKDLDLFCSQGHQLAAQRVADTDTYDNEPHLYRLKNNELILVYRTADPENGGHVDNSGAIVARRSRDWGRSWSDPDVVADTEFDTRNQSVVYDEETDRLTVMYRVYDADSGETRGGFYKTSTNHGRTWSDPRQIPLEFIADPPALRTPYGDFTRTSNGLFVTWVGGGTDGAQRVIEGLFSTDGGRTWGDNVEIVSTSDYDVFMTEPVPEAYTDEKVWTFGRDNDNARFFAVQSEDGGRTWGDAVFFAPREMATGTPCWADVTNPNELTFMWGDRSNDRVSAIDVSARLAWQDPSLIADQPIRDVAVQLADGEGEFGYVQTEAVGRDDRHVLTTWYDEDFAPNIWLASLAGEGSTAHLSAAGGGGPIGGIGGDVAVEAGHVDRFTIGASGDGTWDTVAIERFDVEFGEPFDGTPRVVTTTNAASGLTTGTSDISSDGFTAQVLNYKSSSRPAELDWVAVGPRDG